MIDTRIVLSGLWVATMLTYLWGDVRTLLSGDANPGTLSGTTPTECMWLFIAVLMMIPILMLVLTLILKYPKDRWVNITAAGFWILFNLGSLRGYTLKEQILLITSMGFNALTIWYAWKWVVYERDFQPANLTMRSSDPIMKKTSGGDSFHRFR